MNWIYNGGRQSNSVAEKGAVRVPSHVVIKYNNCTAIGNPAATVSIIVRECTYSGVSAMADSVENSAI